jgi:LCP family protein required for cell wall assembly
MAALAVNVALLVYRVAAVLDAWRGGTNRAAGPGERPVVGSAPPSRGPHRRPGALNLLSVAGLVLVIVTVALPHLAVGRVNLAIYDTLIGLNSGDSSPLGGQSEPDGGLTLPGIAGASGGPDAGSPPPGGILPTPTAAPAWNGTERLNILLIGADHRPGGGEYLTDTMIVASIDPVTKQVAMFSLPRDTADVPLPAHWTATRGYPGGVFPRKINSLYTVARQHPGAFPGNDAQRGFIALKGALGELYHLDIKYYVAVDFEGFLTAMNAVGGVTVDVQVPVRDHHYPADDGRGALNLYIQPGIQHFDGPEALAYARARHETSDFDRGQRQQRILTSIAHQTDLSSLLIPGRLDALFRAVHDTVKTDIPADLFPSLVTLADGIDLNAIRSIVFTPPKYSTVCYPCAPTNEYILRPDVAAIRQTVADALAAPSSGAQPTPSSASSGPSGAP